MLDTAASEPLHFRVRAVAPAMGEPLKRRNLPAFLGLVMIWALAPAAGTDAASKADPRRAAARVKELIARQSNQVEVVTFTDSRLRPVKVVRGSSAALGKGDQVEIVTFANPKFGPVRVLRGGSDAEPAPAQGASAAGRKIETVAFADPRLQPVTVFRGLAFRSPDIDLFRPASTADLGRVAFAVDGAESSHGADPGMWRPEWSAPQGPMQVSAAAAADLGGGDRFDLAQNRLLGRAYLARMFRRYGNWPDAIIAYNWGPGNLDWWIGSGRPADQLPLGVERYRNRVLREVGLRTAPVVASSHADRQIRPGTASGRP